MSTTLVWSEILQYVGYLSAVGVISFHFLLVLLTPVPIPRTEPEKKYTTIPSSTPLALPSLSDPPSIKLSIVIPAYNERDRLPIMLDEAMQYFLEPEVSPERTNDLSDAAQIRVRGRKEGGVELLIVDDGSTDGTSEVARELAGKYEDLMRGKGWEGVEVRVLGLERNRGKGGAVQHGICHSRGRLILFADADGATRFADLDLLLAAMENVVDAEGQGMVVGSRAHLVKSDAVVKRSRMRNILMHGFHLLLRTLGVRGIRDTQCGFKLFTRPTAQLLFPPLHLPKWSFDVELLLLASLLKPPIPVLEIPVAWHEVNGSKIRLGWDSIGMAKDLLVLRGNLLTGRWKVPQRQVIETKVDGIGAGTVKQNGVET